MYQNVRAFMLFILTYWYLKSVDPFKSCDGFFKDLQNRRFCEKFWVNRLFWIAKIILSKFFVRGTKYTKMFGSSCSLFWHIDIENLLIRLKAVMVSLKTSETEDFYHKIGKSIFFNNKELCGEKSLWQSFKNQKSESTVFKPRQIPFIWRITLYNWTCPSTIFFSFKKITRPRRGRFTLYCSHWSVEHSGTIWLSVKPAWLVEYISQWVGLSVFRFTASFWKHLSKRQASLTGGIF